MIVADSGMQMTPQGGYLEGFDRVLAMSGRVARAFLLEPFFLGTLSPNLHQPLTIAVFCGVAFSLMSEV